ncbi:universal stress protein [Shewanella sp. Choline-02u-19]|jgi:universal stress protein A|uniref:universal stress protein n=1 Tax=unclassified Shewanella TaxID=196818 RepID=UPI000C3465B4|nr:MULTISPECIES: universal stress protein [unclassified Shewanella]PKG57027.1 universal stress protein [Shewanella sp. GutDb-MelDb]PKG76702.1 universal stress protein [Shewanella sp. GutCb]PKH54541.1 universal stress protein [Shewanella sp. Bg11-22]PKI28599.1 universal stress protein [Shewanella sp. Choline-02u-19]
MRSRQILCPTDFSITASHALSYAVEMANLYGVGVRLLHVVSEPFSDHHYGLAVESAAELEQQITSFATESLMKIQLEVQQELNAGLTVKTVIRSGLVLREILAEAEEGEIGMIVIASHGRQGISHLLNPNIGEALAYKAKCPVLVVK